MKKTKNWKEKLIQDKKYLKKIDEQIQFCKKMISALEDIKAVISKKFIGGKQDEN